MVDNITLEDQTPPSKWHSRSNYFNFLAIYTRTYMYSLENEYYFFKNPALKKILNKIFYFYSN